MIDRETKGREYGNEARDRVVRQREKDEERSRGSGGRKRGEKKKEEKKKYGGEEEGEKDKEKCEGGERGEGPRERRAEMWERVSRNRCREGFRRRQYFNRRQIYRPPAARPYEMAGARVTCHFVKWSHVSRGHLAVCLLGGSVLSVMCRYARISSSSCPRSRFKLSNSRLVYLDPRRASTLVSVAAPTRFFQIHINRAD